MFSFNLQHCTFSSADIACAHAFEHRHAGSGNTCNRHMHGWSIVVLVDKPCSSDTVKAPNTETSTPHTHILTIWYLVTILTWRVGPKSHKHVHRGRRLDDRLCLDCCGHQILDGRGRLDVRGQGLSRLMFELQSSRSVHPSRLLRSRRASEGDDRPKRTSKLSKNYIQNPDPRL